MFNTALGIAITAFRAGQDVQSVLSALGYSSTVIQEVISQMKPTTAPTRRRQGNRDASETVVAAGRGRLVPRFNLPADSLLGLVQSQRRTLAFTFSKSLPSVAGAYTENTFTLNSPYHCDGTNDATGFQKYMAFYSKCYVLGARIIIKGILTPGATLGTKLNLTISTNGTAFSSSDAAISNGMCKWLIVYKNPDRAVFTESVDVAKFLHRPSVLSASDLYATSSAAPAQVVVAHMGIGGLAAENSTFTYELQVLFDCVFVDPIPFT